jgi:chromosome segregation ATPase
VSLASELEDPVEEDPHAKASLEGLKAQYEELRSAHDKMLDELHGVQEEMFELAGLLHVRQTRLDEVTAAHAQLELRHKEALARCDTAEKAQRGAEEERTRAAERVENLQRLLQQRQEEMDEAKRVHEQDRNAYQQLIAVHAALETSQLEAQERLREARSGRQQLERDNQDLLQHNESLRQQLQESQTSLLVATTSLATIKCELGRITAEKELGSEIVTKELREAKLEASTLRGRCEELQSHLRVSACEDTFFIALTVDSPALFAAFADVTRQFVHTFSKNKSQNSPRNRHVKKNVIGWLSNYCLYDKVTPNWSWL